MNEENSSQYSFLFSVKTKGVSDEKRFALTTPVSEFSNMTKNSGVPSYTISEEAELGNYLPQGFSGEQVAMALHLYSSGASGSHLENQIDNKIEGLGLTETQSQSLYAIPYLVSCFEEYDPGLTSQIQSVYTPEVSFEQVTPSYSPQPGQFSFQLDSELGYFQPVIAEIKGRISHVAKSNAKDFVKKAIKKGGKKLLEKGAKIAAKAGVKAAAQVISTAIPGAGNIATFIATEVAPRVIGGIKNAIGKIGEVLTSGEKDKRKQAIYIGGGMLVGGILTGSAALLLSGGFVALGSAALLAGGVGIGVGLLTGISAIFIGAATAITSAILLPLFITFVVVPILIAIIIFIINTGAYIVPQFVPDAPGSGSYYIQVEKLAKEQGSSDDPQPSLAFDNGENVTVEYTITVTALRGTLSEISFEWVCEFFNESGGTCPAYGNVTINGEEQPALTDLDALTPPEIISPANPYVITYTQGFDGNLSSMQDSLTMDTFTVTANVEEVVVGETAQASASVIIGNPPASSCPIIGAYISYPSYTGADCEDCPGHGSNQYWSGSGNECGYDIPYRSGCYGPTASADTGRDNDCRDQSRLCDEYGAAVDIVARGAGDLVQLPIVLGRTVNWTRQSQFSNWGGRWGWGVNYTGTDDSGNSYFIYFTHLNQANFPASGLSGTVIGSLMGPNYYFDRPHAHIELSINGGWVRPDFLCGGVGP